MNRAARKPRTDTPAGPQEDPHAAVDTAAIERFLGYLLRRAQLAAFQGYARHAKPHAVTTAQFSIMTIVAANPGVSQIALAGALAIEPSRLVALLNALEQRGLAARARSKLDRRQHGVFLTKKGLVLLQELTALADEADRRLTARLTAREREALSVALHKLFAGEALPPA
jgi:DNA-binding MarR family transcriptional regulator